MFPRLLALIVLLASCGEESAFRYEGEPGQPLPITFANWVPMLEAHFPAEGEGPSLRMLVDTGAPLTAIAKTALPSVSPGPNHMTFEAFQLTFPDWPAVVMDLFGTAGYACSEARPAGLIGGDLLRHFRVGLDYQGQRAFLFDGPSGDPAVGAATDEPVAVPITVAGGGAVQLSDPATQVRVSATRLVAEATVEGQAVTAVIDTGASLTVASQQLLNRLAAAGRPHLCCESVTTVSGETQAEMTRLKEVRLGAAAVTNLPVLLLADAELFAALSAEVGREITLLIGGSFLRYFALRVDYSAEQLELARYQHASHVDPAEFVSAGFAICKARQSEDGMIVTDVYRGTEAERRAVVAGAKLLAVDGQSVTQLSADDVRSLIRARPLGTTVNFTFRSAAPLALPVQRLLENFE